MVLTATPNPGPPDPVNNPNVPGLNPQQAKNARLIVAVGKALGVNDNGIITALAVAGTESSWQNYANSRVQGSEQFPHDAVGHDHDSIGLFQQRAGDYGWMPKGDLKTGMDPVHQAAAFYGGTPNASAPGLMQQRGWESSNPAVISQQVQGSAFPDAYSRFVTQAKGILQSLQSTPPAALPFKPRMTGPNMPAPAAPVVPPAPPPPAPKERQASAALNRANPEPVPVQQAPAPNPRPGIPSPMSTAPAPPPATGAPARGPMRAI